jgi:sugar-specific transcriptional regulator TrmB
LEQKLSEELQTLSDLGLTLIQARVYSALVWYGPSKVSEIAKNSNVARPDVYRTLLKLQEIGLVEKIIEMPVKYKVTPIGEGLSLLLDRKTKQYEELRARTHILLETARMKKPKKFSSNINQFVLVPGGKTVIERIRLAIEKAMQSVDLVLSWKRFSRGIVSTFAESIEIAWKKKVEIRFAIERPSESKTDKELVKFCREKPSCDVRLIQHQPKTVLGIYDKKEVFIIVDPEKDLSDSPALWSNNPSLISLAEDYFEVLWVTASENTHS